MVHLQPVLKTAMFFLQLEDGIGIFDGGIYFQAVPNDARVGQEAGAVSVSIGCYLFNVEVVVGLAEACLFPEDGLPAQSCLVDLEDQSPEQFVIVMYGKAVKMI